MNRPKPGLPALVLLTLFVPATAAFAQPEDPTAQQVSQARRCAADTRIVSRAFGDVRDSVKAGEKKRGKTQLAAADSALATARSSCATIPDVSEVLDMLAGEAEALRRALD